VEVACTYRNLIFAVLSGTKPEPRDGGGLGGG
jgi:hypothetical protein